MGRFIELIPRPVIAGFLSGIGLTILCTQLPVVLGYDVTHDEEGGALGFLAKTLRKYRQTEPASLAVGLIAVGVGWLAGSLLPASSAEERAATKVKEAAAPAVAGAAKQTRPTSKTPPSRPPGQSGAQRLTQPPRSRTRRPHATCGIRPRPPATP